MGSGNNASASKLDSLLLKNIITILTATVLIKPIKIRVSLNDNFTNQEEQVMVLKQSPLKSQVSNQLTLLWELLSLWRDCSYNPPPLPTAVFTTQAATIKGILSPSVCDTEKLVNQVNFLLLTAQGRQEPFRGTHPNIHLHHFVQRNPNNLHPKIIGCFVKCSMGTLGGHAKWQGRRE